MGRITCRPNCGACCIVPSISSAIPGMPVGKSAFTTCVNLDQRTRTCTIWMSTVYPDVCREFTPDDLYCGDSKESAFCLLTEAEQLTAPEEA